MSPEDYINGNSTYIAVDGYRARYYVEVDDAIEAVRMVREEFKVKDARIKVLEDTLLEIERSLKKITDEI